jgi:hypothetical protein
MIELDQDQNAQNQSEGVPQSGRLDQVNPGRELVEQGLRQQSQRLEMINDTMISRTVDTTSWKPVYKR